MCGSLDGLVQKLSQVDGSAFSAERAPRDTFAFGLLTVVLGDILFIGRLQFPLAFVESTVKRFSLVNPNCNLLEHKPQLRALKIKRRRGEYIGKHTPQ